MGPLTVIALITMVFITIVAVVGNTMAVISVVKFQRLRSQLCFHFLASLALADTAVALLVMTWSIVHTALLYAWPFGWFFCYFWMSCDVMCCTASILHLLVIALDRYVAIVHPLRYVDIMTPRRARILIATVWVTSIAISFVPIYAGWFAISRDQLYANQDTCLLEVNKTYAIVSSCTSFFVPFVLLITFYVKIYRIAFLQAARMRQDSVVRSEKLRIQHEAKAIKTVGSIVGFFSACWFPFFIMYITLAFCGSSNCQLSRKWIDLITWIGYANSAINPILYGFMQREFRASFLKLMCCFSTTRHAGYLNTARRFSNGGHSMESEELRCMNPHSANGRHT